MSTDFGRHRLQPFPGSEGAPAQDLVNDLSVDVTRLNGRLVLLYRLTGDIDALRLPAPAPAVRTDDLWRHTCFEAFVAQPGGEYWEYNFSPSGAWAAYHFAGYRLGMEPNLKGSPPRLRLDVGDTRFELEVTIDLSWLLRPAAGLRLGLSAVIEDRNQALSYWALAHPGEKPDFHHAGGFVIDLG